MSNGVRAGFRRFYREGNSGRRGAIEYSWDLNEKKIRALLGTELIDRSVRLVSQLAIDD